MVPRAGLRRRGLLGGRRGDAKAFDDTPAALLKRFMKIALDDPDALVRGATGVIAARTTTLAGLYAP